MRSKRDKLPNKIEDIKPSKMLTDYANKLGIELPQGVNKTDVRALIDRDLDEDDEANLELKLYAKEKEIKFSEYVGNKYLHALIFDHLELFDKIIFFCYCVYKFNYKKENEGLLESKYLNLFEQFAREYMNDNFFIESMNEYVGDELAYFGKSQRTMNSGVIKNVYGGSDKTRAYIVVKQYLQNNIC